MVLSPRLFSGIDLLGVALLHFLWQGAAIGVVYYVFRHLCQSAKARYRLALSTLLALAICPVVTLAYLQSQLATVGVHATRAPMSLGTFNVVADQAQWSRHELLPWLVAVWICGVTLLAIRSLRQWLRLLLIVDHAAPLPAHWSLHLVRLGQRFDLRRPIRLLSAVSISTPMLIGWFRPVILLPASMLSGFSPEQLELIIAHELAHVRRWDYLVNLMQVVIETVLFYHPVIHWISRDARNSREECCDDLVLSVAHGDPLIYARTLADLEEIRHGLVPALPALGFGGGVLLSRVRRIVGVGETSEPMPRSYELPLLLLLAAMLCIAWRPRPVDIDLAGVLSSASTHAMALVSGNPGLTLDKPALATERFDLPLDAALSMPPGSVASSTARVDPMVDTEAAEKSRIGINRPGVQLAAAVLPQPADVISSTGLQVPAVLAKPSETVPPPALRPLHVVAPVYPPQAMADGVQGSVELEFRVEGSGRVGAIRVLTSQPAGIFDNAAKLALEHWRFPQTGNPASTEPYTQKFTFNLNSRNGVGSPKNCRHVTGTLLCRQPGD